jgi:hypothetical protein
MADPSAADAVTGVKTAFLIAGFAGGIASLSFVKELTAKQAVLAVLTGALTAGYATPIVLHYFGGPSGPSYENGAAFVIGLTAMNIIPGLLKLSEIFKRDPRSFIGGGK